jgi:protein-S-isoprenylcysteine O-methyltransferase Ste14
METPPRVLDPIFSSRVVSWMSAAVALAALLATMKCWKEMGRSWRMGIDPNEKTSLVVTGPYAYVRHPIYALSLLLMLSTVVCLPSPLMMVAGVIHGIFLIWEARREEKHLATTHGEIYLAYCARVGRFCPTLLARGNKA